MSDVQKQVREFIEENFMIGQDESELSNEESFLESGLIDSTGILEIVSFLEETFGFDVEDDEMIPDNLDSVKNLEEFINRKKAA